MRVLILLFCCMAYLAGEEPHHTTAFMGNVHEVDLLFSYSRYATDSFWNKQSDRHSTHNYFKKHSCMLYGEYAFNWCNALFLKGGYAEVHERLNGKSQALQEIELGWKSQVFEQEGLAFALQFIALIPLVTKNLLFFGENGELKSIFFVLINLTG